MGSPSASPALSPHAADAAGDADGAMERDVERDAVGVDKRSHVSASYVALEHMASRLAVVTSIICMRRPCRPYKTAERASSNLRLISWWPSRRAIDGADDVALLFEQLVDGVLRGHSVRHGVREE